MLYIMFFFTDNHSFTHDYKHEEAPKVNIKLHIFPIFLSLSATGLGCVLKTFIIPYICDSRDCSIKELFYTNTLLHLFIPDPYTCQTNVKTSPRSSEAISPFEYKSLSSSVLAAELSEACPFSSFFFFFCRQPHPTVSFTICQTTEAQPYDPH